MNPDKRGEMPSGKQNCENLKLALKGEEMDSDHINHIKVNLDLLNKEITRVKGDIAKLGISLDDLKYIDRKLTTKATNLGADFPAEQVGAFQEILKQAEQAPAPEKLAEVIDLDAVRTRKELQKKEATSKEQSLVKLVAIKLKNDLDFNTMDAKFIETKKQERGYPQNISEKPLNTDESNRLFDEVEAKLRKFKAEQKQTGQAA